MSAEVLQAEVHHVWSDTAPDPACSRLKLEQAGHDSYARSLQASLSLRKDIVLDMTSLKTCLDPEALPEVEAMEEEEAGEERGAKVSCIYTVYTKFACSGSPNPAAVCILGSIIIHIYFPL